MTPEIAEIYGNRVRIRACGLCWRNDSLLLIKHRIGPHGLWAPPGGGVEYGERLEETLRREFREETGLEITPEKFRFGCEFLKQPLHSIELFFDVSIAGGMLKKGDDPELQLLEEVEFLSQKDIDALPQGSVHGVITRFQNLDAIRQLTGFYRI